MPNFFFTGGWGLAYLVIMAVTMLPSLLVASTREYAAIIIITWLADRLALAAFDLHNFYLVIGTVYIIIACSMVYIYKDAVALVIAAMLFIISASAYLGYLNILPFDIAASIRELVGVIAMLTIIGNPNGTIAHHTWKGGDSVSPVRRSVILFTNDTK